MLNYRLISSKNANATIIFLHEGLGCVEMWKNYPDLVCEKLNCNGVVYDRAGYGKSDGSLKNRQVDYLHLASKELHDFILKLNLQSQNIILYGHSDGGSIALIYAGLYPNSCLAVVTEAAHVFVEEVTLNGIKPAVNAFENGKLNGLKKYHGNKFEEVFYAWVNIWNHPTFLDWNIEQEIRSIQCPQLIIQGKDDQYGTLKQVESITQNTTGKTTIFTPENCGHAPFKEKQDEVLNQVELFIKPLI